MFYNAADHIICMYTILVIISVDSNYGKIQPVTGSSPDALITIVLGQFDVFIPDKRKRQNLYKP